MTHLPCGLIISHHARTRMRQRAIGQAELHVALSVGDVSGSHGDLVYTVTDRCLRGTEWSRLTDRLRGLTVVITADNVVRTVKWLRRLRRRAGPSWRLLQAA